MSKTLMELDDFISGALEQIMRGVEAAEVRLAKLGALCPINKLGDN